MKACFVLRPMFEPDPELGVKPEQIELLSQFSIEAIKSALSHPDIGRGGGASVYLGHRTVSRALAATYLSHLERVREWQAARRNCWLTFFAALTAIFTGATALIIYATSG